MSCVWYTVFNSGYFTANSSKDGEKVTVSHNSERRRLVSAVAMIIFSSMVVGTIDWEADESSVMDGALAHWRIPEGSNVVGVKTQAVIEVGRRSAAVPATKNSRGGEGATSTRSAQARGAWHYSGGASTA